MTTLRLRSKVNFPATVTASGGFQVVKANGIWTVSPDWTALALETTIPDPEARQLWTYDPSADTYYRLTVQALIDNLPAGPAGDPGATGATGAGYTATSTSSQTIGNSGTKTFTTQSGLAYTAGARVRAADSAAPSTNWMEGVVTSYSSTTLVFTADKSAGSGTLTSWNINLAGQPGADGAGTGDVVGPGSATDNAIARFDLTTGKLIQNSVVTIADSTGDIAGTGFVRPASNDGGALGSATLSYSDLFLATGGVINWNNGDVTVTHSSNTLAFGGASSGYTFDAAMLPSANDAAALGASGTAWSDAFFASGAVLNFNAGNYTITHSAGLLTLNGALSIGTGNAFTAGTVELGAASDTTLSRSAAGIVAVEGVVMKNTGKETIWIPATSMISRTTNGAAAGTVELATNKNMVKSLDFDTTTQEFAQFSVAFPKSWNLGTVTFVPHMSQLTTAAGNVVFGLAGVAVSTTDALDVAFGTAQTSDTTVGTANLEYVGPESSAITIAGTPAVGDRVMFQINRTVASDNLAQDARLHGIRLFFTTSAATDA